MFHLGRQKDLCDAPVHRDGLTSSIAAAGPTMSSPKKMGLRRIGSTGPSIASCPDLEDYGESNCNGACGSSRTTDSFFNSFLPTFFPSLFVMQVSLLCRARVSSFLFFFF